jgi:hypothetical protein
VPARLVIHGDDELFAVQDGGNHAKSNKVAGVDGCRRWGGAHHPRRLLRPLSSLQIAVSTPRATFHEGTKRAALYIGGAFAVGTLPSTGQIGGRLTMHLRALLMITLRHDIDRHGSRRPRGRRGNHLPDRESTLPS